MKHLYNFEKFKILENKDYEETSWTDNGITITIQEVQKYLDDNKVPTTKLDVEEIFPMCCHKDKTDNQH